MRGVDATRLVVALLITVNLVASSLGYGDGGPAWLVIVVPSVLPGQGHVRDKVSATIVFLAAKILITHRLSKVLCISMIIILRLRVVVSVVRVERIFVPVAALSLSPPFGT